MVPDLTWTTDLAHQVLDETLRRVGQNKFRSGVVIDDADRPLFRVQTTSRDLAASVVGPGHNPESVRHTQRLASYLRSYQIGCVEPAEGLPPCTHDTKLGTISVVFWNWFTTQGPATPPELGRLLSELHQVPAPVWLRDIDLLAPVRAGVAAADRSGQLTAESRTWLGPLLERAAEAVEAGSQTRQVVVHGNWHRGAVHRSAGGHTSTGWGRSGRGPIGMDLASAANGALHFGEGEAFKAVVGAYTADGAPFDLEAVQALVPVAEAAEVMGAFSAGRTEEALRRLESLSGGRPYRWVR